MSDEMIQREEIERAATLLADLHRCSEDADDAHLAHKNLAIKAMLKGIDISKSKAPDQPKPSEKMHPHVWVNTSWVSDEWDDPDCLFKYPPNGPLKWRAGFSEYLSKKEHTAAIAEKEKRIEALEAALRKIHTFEWKVKEASDHFVEICDIAGDALK